MTTTRSARLSASSWSCVTRIVAIRSVRCSSRSSSRMACRRRASRFERGSSNSRTRRADHDGPRHRDPLLLPARQLAGIARIQPAETGQVEGRGHARRALGCGDLPHPEPVGDVLGDGHVGEEGVALEDDAHVTAIGRLVDDGEALDQDLARGRVARSLPPSAGSSSCRSPRARAEPRTPPGPRRDPARPRPPYDRTSYGGRGGRDAAA